MNRLSLPLLLALAACGPSSVGDEPTLTLEPGTARLGVALAQMRSSKGTVYCSLFNSAEGFPGKSRIIGGVVEQSAASTGLRCDYAGLPAGDYAVSMAHDENGNGELDKSFVGAPTEPWGTTNNVTHPSRAPTFDEARVTVGDGETLELQIDAKL
jgi:uncharacterized protein (DUF2141 family)